MTEIEEVFDPGIVWSRDLEQKTRKNRVFALFHPLKILFISKASENLCKRLIQCKKTWKFVSWSFF